MNDIVKTAAVTNYQPAPNPMVPKNMNDALRLAEFMSKSNALPTHFQGQPGNCLMVIEQSMRWNMSPFAVAQCTSFIKGKMMYEGKLVHAAVEESGAIVGLLDYKFKGEGENRTITAFATRKGETEPKEVEVKFKDVKTGNEIWTKQTDQQLCYSAARVWARRWTPGVMLGVYTREEFENTSPERDHFNGEIIESTSEHVAPGKVYVFQNVKSTKECTSIAEWSETWAKAIKAYVQANAPDKLEKLREMNAPFFTEIAATDPDAVAAVRDLIANALGEAPPERMAGQEG